MTSQFGMIGLGVMGSNLALNVADHGFTVAVWNREPEKTVTFVAEKVGFTDPVAKRLLGNVIVGDIGCPRELIEEVARIPGT